MDKLGINILIKVEFGDGLMVFFGEDGGNIDILFMESFCILSVLVINFIF